MLEELGFEFAPKLPGDRLGMLDAFEPRVRHLGEQRANRDDQPHVEQLGKPGDLRAERAPAQLWFGADEGDDVEVVADRRARQDVVGPDDLAGTLVVDPGQLDRIANEVQAFFGP